MVLPKSCTSLDKKVRKHKHTTKNYMYSNSFFLKNMINRIFSCTSSDKKVRKHKHTTKNYMYSNLFFLKNMINIIFYLEVAERLRREESKLQDVRRR
jgi:hypothetical protein